MTKKKIRYSEFPLPDAAPAPPREPAPPAAAPVPPVAKARAAKSPAVKAPAVAPAPVAEPPHAVVGRLTPVRGSVAIPRPTPVRPSVAIPHHTPMRGSIAIVRDAVPAPAPASPAAPSAAPAGQALRDQARLRAGTVELLVFGVANEWFGVELAAVDEAMDLPAVRHVPEMPPAMLGVMTVRGALTALYSPASALGLHAPNASSALVFKRGRGRLAIAVDDVDDVHTLDLAQLRDPPAADAADGLVLGVLRYRDALLALVDAEALIAACQTVPVLETA
jgi:chemotaxis signal transduction protein